MGSAHSFANHFPDHRRRLSRCDLHAQHPLSHRSVRLDPMGESHGHARLAYTGRSHCFHNPFDAYPFAEVG